MEASESLINEWKNMNQMIRKRSAAYTADWDFNENTPDMGSALALLFAGMMKDTLDNYDRLPDMYRLKLYNLLDARKLPAGAANGYVTFSTVNDEVRGTRLEAGEKVRGTSEDGETVGFEIQEDIFVSPAKLKGIYYVSGKEDYIGPSQQFPVSMQQKKGKNRQEHDFYIGHHTLFRFDTAGELVLDFHFLGSRDEEEAGAFLMNGVTWYYYSEDGFVEFPGFRFEGGRVYLQKEKEMPAFAQTKVQGKESFWLRLVSQKLPPESRISFRSLSLGSSAGHLLPQTVYDGNLELDTEDFLPFGEHPFPYAQVFISSNEVFCKKGAKIGLDFELEFLEYPGELQSPRMPVRWRNIMHTSEFKEPVAVDMAVDSVVWEYYNGSGWTRIPDTRRYEAIFREKSERRRVSVDFVCPEDICPFLLSAGEEYGIRVRITGISNLYAMDGIYIAPRIKNLTMHYRYGDSFKEPDYAFSFNHMKTEQIACSREFTPFYNLFPDQDMLYLSFSGALQEEGIRLWFAVEKKGSEACGRYRYEYYGSRGWSLLKIEDGTKNFSRSGMVSTYREHAFAEQEFFGCRGYWIRIIREPDDDTAAGNGGPVISAIRLNSVPVRAVEGSGKRGNLPPGAIQTMDRNIGFINAVTNDEAMAGGCDEETTLQAVRRMSAFLRHGGRAVTQRDYEDLVYSKVRDVLQVKCYPGRNANGDRAPGHVTLAVLLDTKIQQREYFAHVRENIYRCLLPHIDRRIYDEGRLHIVEPEWVALNLHMSIIALPALKAYQLRDKIVHKISGFIDPVTGNFDGNGWEIGNLPTIVQIQNICSQMEEVLYVKNISLRDERPAGCYTLGISGQHEIEISFE
ncbi:MAG: baseplate J/gp47 family protein [Clostridium sp.]|nr:baseplate J/gp47 family protein [Clostridium sp.]